MWIAGVNIRLRIITLLFILFVVFTMLLQPSPIFLALSIGLWTGIFTAIAYLAYRQGIFMRLYSWTDRGGSHEVRQYVNMKYPEENCRGICGKGNADPQVWDSRIYTAKRTEWAYFDIIRQLFDVNRQRLPQKVLMLGGGGGSISYGISRQFPTTQIDIVELSKQMIHVAKRYFFQKNNQQTTWIHQDASAYVQRPPKTNNSYDCIIVDLFENGTLPKFLYSRPFIRALHSRLKKDGFLFINFGWQNVHSKLLLSLYTALFKNFRLCLYNFPSNKNIIGVTWPIRQNAQVLPLN